MKYSTYGIKGIEAYINMQNLDRSCNFVLAFSGLTSISCFMKYFIATRNLPSTTVASILRQNKFSELIWGADRATDIPCNATIVDTHMFTEVWKQLMVQSSYDTITYNQMSTIYAAANYCYDWFLANLNYDDKVQLAKAIHADSLVAQLRKCPNLSSNDYGSVLQKYVGIEKCHVSLLDIKKQL